MSGSTVWLVNLISVLIVLALDPGTFVLIIKTKLTLGLLLPLPFFRLPVIFPVVTVFNFTFRLLCSC